MKKLEFKTKDDDKIIFELSQNKSILSISIQTEKYQDPFDIVASIDVGLNVFEQKQLRDFLNNKI